jgi:hypothetical protein
LDTAPGSAIRVLGRSRGFALAAHGEVALGDRAHLSEIVQRERDGRLRTNIGNVSALDDAVATFNATERRAGKTVIRVRP